MAPFQVAIRERTPPFPSPSLLIAEVLEQGLVPPFEPMLLACGGCSLLMSPFLSLCSIVPDIAVGTKVGTGDIAFSFCPFTLRRVCSHCQAGGGGAVCHSLLCSRSAGWVAPFR